MSDVPRPRFHLLKAYGLSLERLREAIIKDPEVRADAEAEVAACVKKIEDRCHMTRDYAAAIRRTLA